MESISSVGLHCGRIGAMVVEVGAPEARALVARGAVSTNQLLGTQRTSKLTQSCLQNISKFSQFVSVSNAQLLGTQQTSKWRSNRLETGIKLQGTRASLVNCFFDRRPTHADTTRRGRIIFRKDGKWNQFWRDKTMYSSLFEWHHKVNLNQVSWKVFHENTSSGSVDRTFPKWLLKTKISRLEYKDKKTKRSQSENKWIYPGWRQFFAWPVSLRSRWGFIMLHQIWKSSFRFCNNLFRLVFCARPDFNYNFLLWRNNKKVHIFSEPWQLTFSALSLPNRWTWAILSLTFKSGEKWFQKVEKFQNSEIWGLNNAITDGREGLTNLTCTYLC